MNILQALQQAKLNLLTATQATDSPSLDAEVLLSFVIHKNRTYLYTWPEHELSIEEITLFFSLIQERVIGKPIAYLVNNREFWGLNFKVNQHTLIPRPDSEILIATALTKIASHPAPHILDLGTGSGALICALKTELPHATATATDFQTKTLAVAIENAQILQLEIDFKLGNWLEPVFEQKFDLIVSNPPYIEEQDPHLQQGDLRFEPITALTSGKTGLEDITSIAKTAKKHLNNQAWLILEHGFNQAQDVAKILKQNGLQNIAMVRNYHQQPRISLGQNIK